MDNEEYLKQLATAEKNQKKTELEQARASALTSIEQEKQALLPTFETSKQQANVASQIGAKNLAEFWAKRGQTRQGISAQAELSRQNTLGGTLGGIEQEKLSAETGFAQQASQAGTDYQNNLASAYGDVDADLRQNLYDEKVRQQAIAESRRSQAVSIAASKAAATTAFNRNKELAAIDDEQKKLAAAQAMALKGINPYTGTTNSDAKDPITGKVTNVFNNGYQPNNIGGNKLASTGVMTNVNGQEQNIWKTSTTSKNKSTWLNPFDTKTVENYYFWDGQNNKYWKLTEAEKKELGL